MRNPVAISVLFAALILGGCNPILRTHGYVPTADATPQEINPNTDTKASVLAALGSPSVEGTFDEEVEEDTWYYINQVRERYAYLRPKFRNKVSRLSRLTPTVRSLKLRNMALVIAGS